MAATGDGTTTTASTALQLALPAQGLFYGYREATEDWTGLKQRYASNTSIANWVKAEASRVDAWVLRNFERPDLIGGWMHDYVDPVTGLSVAWTPTSTEPPNGSTDKEKKFKAAWVAWSRGYNIAQVRTAARVYRVTGNSQYAKWAAEQLDFYAANYNKWPLQTMIGKARMFAQGLDEATNSFALLDAARLLKDYAGVSRSNVWRDQFFMPMAENLKPPKTLVNNIGLWQQAAVAAIAMRFQNTAMLDVAQYGPEGIQSILSNNLTADNIWIEGSFDYNNYVAKALSELLMTASAEGYGSRFSKEKEQALRMLLAPIDYRFDNNTLPNPSDSTSVQTPISTNAHWQLVRNVPTYWGLAKAGSARTWDSVLDIPATVSATQPALPKVVTRLFPAIQQAVLRSGSWQAFVHYGQTDANHFQEELLNFELHEGVTPIATDPGTISYGSPYSQNYFRKGPANNVPLINGIGQLKPSAGKVISFSPAENRLIVEQPAYQTDARVTRGYRVTSQGFAEQSRMTITTGTAKRLGLAFSTACTVAPAGGLAALSSTPSLPAVPAFTYWNGTKAYSAGSAWSMTLTCGSKRYALNVFGPSAQTIYVGKAPNTPMPSERWSIYYETTSADALFETEITALQ